MILQIVPASEQAERNRRRAVVIEQYVQCASVLHWIYFYCPDVAWKKDGIGRCDWEGSMDDDLTRTVYDWIELRHGLRDRLNPFQVENEDACTYHVAGVGCPLGNLKSPACLADTAGVENLPDSFRILGRVRKFLYQIIQGTPIKVDADGRDGGPDSNWPHVLRFVKNAKIVLRHAQAVYFKEHGRLPLPVFDPRTGLVGSADAWRG